MTSPDESYEREHAERRTPEWTADEGEGTDDVEPRPMTDPDSDAGKPKDDDPPQHGYGYE